MPTVYVTAPRDKADEMARILLEERLAACVNRVDCESTYWWNGEMHTDPEAIMLVKTTDDQYDELRDRIEELHPYDVPCIERFEETDVLPSFAQWRADAVESND